MVGYGTEPVATTEPSILNVWHEHGAEAEVVLVDIPIGLPDWGRRVCDTAAARLLGARGNTVFSVPCEAAVAERDYEAAKAVNEERGGGGLSSQTWGLIPRIREVDALLTEIPAAAERIYESHPEVCFAQFSGGDRALPSKRSGDGLDERLRILEDVDAAFGSAVAEFVEERTRTAEWHHRIQSGRLDDVVDAAVLALTAETISRPFPTLPEGADPDGRSVIVHPGARRDD